MTLLLRRVTPALAYFSIQSNVPSSYARAPFIHRLELELELEFARYNKMTSHTDEASLQWPMC